MSEIENFLLPNVEDDICLLAAQNIREYEEFYEKNANDDVCIHAIEKFENESLLHDGNDHLFVNIEQSNTASNLDSIEYKIQNVIRRSSIAGAYLADSFYAFDLWPNYIKLLFVSNNIQNYNYVTRNKLCLFFWGNGASYEVMCNLSYFFAPKTSTKTYAEIKKNDLSHKKCLGLYKTYTEQQYNPQYSHRYYYYNILQKRMLFIDGTPRHFGKRVTGHQNYAPRWY